ncbi:glucose/arabinose dehydrogenase [Kibdelosporangium banguiense]|uniref:Glucose/arabinose dehydrogenase n=1 Tax=Kibdelosporangium banguiense TaxID=1365924 RepID=A0ABS4T9R0_9PSEU|nr:PQQ-dependent sugar dehydrogenase [Kibdelosporangium banguiense]MBP2321149.1 glucose/arabinose dehydrogenase [Kibdelosporangium banguiense]
MRTRRAGAAITAAAAVLGAVVATAPAAQAAPALPSGFALVDTPSGQQPGTLTDVAYLPDGSVLTTGRLGSVQWVPQGGQPVQIHNIPVYTGGSLGLTGIAVSPDYNTTRTVYTTQAVSDGSAKSFRLSKWRTLGTNEPTGLVDESIVLDFPANADNKGIQDIAVEPVTGNDPAKTVIWVAIGDNSNVQAPATATKDNVDQFALRALDPAQPTGKILRIRANGRGVEDNPFYSANDQTSWRSRNYLSGLRDPQVTLDPRGGVIVTDTGWAARDEVNLAFPGQNLKWPCWEGTTKTPGYQDLPACQNLANTEPLHETNHGTTDTILGGVPYMGTSYPEAYRGSHFIANKGAHRLSTLRYDTSGKVTQVATSFATDIGDPASVITAPNGDVVILDAATSTLRRVSYKPANKAPVAGFNATVDAATRKVSFDAGASTDPEREAVTYQWNFGDEGTGAGKTIEHTYAAGDRFTVTLTVTDVHGATATSNQVVLPGEASPELALNTPGLATVFSVNQAIAVGASTYDVVDGSIPVHWKAEHVRCVRDRSCEISPLQTGSGPDFTIAFPNETDGHVVITATAENSRAAVVSRRYIANPRLVRLQVLSSHSSQFQVATGESANRLVTAGSSIQFTAPQTALEGAAQFTRWSDNANPSPTRQITMGVADFTLKADYVSAIQKRYADDAAVRAWMGSPVGFELFESNSHWQQYAGGRLYWTAQHGVKVIGGTILVKYNGLGGHAFLGAPSTDELISRANGGDRLNHFVGSGSIYWVGATNTAYVIYGPSQEKWISLGADNSVIGYPTIDITGTPDGVGRYTHFSKENGSIYWHPSTGAFAVMGEIKRLWAAVGWETSVLGYPRTDELVGRENSDPGRAGRYSHFQNGSIYWSSGTGAREVHGEIGKKYLALNAELSVLGYPTINEGTPPDRIGRFNHFQGGSIYWTNATGAHEVHGEIKRRWESLGWETSYLGYPISDEYDIPGYKRSDFQFGYITYNLATGQVLDRRY